MSHCWYNKFTKSTCYNIKTPGIITIQPTAQNSLIENLENQVHQALRMSYKLKELQFGLGNNTFDFPIAHKSKIV